MRLNMNLQDDHVLGEIESDINDAVLEKNKDSIDALQILKDNLQELSMADAYNDDLLNDEIYDINQAIGKMDAKLWRSE